MASHANSTLHDDELMAFTSTVQLRAPLAMSAWTETLQDVHVRNGFGPAAPAAYSNLGSALAQWRMAQKEASSDAALGLQPITEGAMCPCCSHVYRVIEDWDTCKVVWVA